MPEKELDQSHIQPLLSSIVENSDDAIIGKDLEGVIFYWNNGAQKIYGYAIEEVIGQPVSILIPPDRKNEMSDFLDKIKHSELVEHFETKRLRKDGQIIDVSITISPIKNATREIIGASTIARDITKQKQAEQALLDSQIKYKVLYDSSKDAIMITVPDKGFIAGNPAAIELFGCKNEQDFIIHTPSSLSPEFQPDGKPSQIKSQEMMRIAMEKGSHFFEWMHKRVDGKEFLATVLLSRMELRGQKILQATVRDITRIKEIEKNLKAISLEWDRTFNSISDFIFVLDRNYTIIKANSSFFRAMKVEPKEVLGKKCYQIMHKADKPWPCCPVMKTNGDCKVHVEEINDPNIGIPLLVTASPILDENGNFDGIVHIAKDISIQKKTEEELKAKIDALERFQKVTIDRELKMIEMKKKIAELEGKLSQKPSGK